MMSLLFRGSVYLSCSLVVYIFRSGWLLDMVPWNLGVTSLTSQEEGVNEKKKAINMQNLSPDALF